MNLHSVNLDTWDKVAQFADEHMAIKPSYLDRVNKRKFPVDAFSLGQLASKAWLLNQLSVMHIPSPSVVAILGCWIGSMVPMLHQRFNIGRIYGFDLDPESIQLAEEFNLEYVNNGWKFKGVVMDLQTQSSDWFQFQTGGELIEVKPEWLINTSCEHMDTHWFETADTDQLIIMQTNNSKEFDGHINTCYNIEEMQEKYPLDQTYFVGELITPFYTRFMQIGYK